MSKKKKKTHRSGRNTTPLAGHKKVGKVLVPPFLQIPGISFASWSNDRLPEMLWACLVITVVPREAALELFRKIASIGVRYRRQPEENGSGWTLRHSDLQNQPRELVEEIVGVMRQARTGIQALRPLLLLEGLPAHQWWKAALAVAPNEDDWQTLGKAVQTTLDHQSQEATDVRWVSILFRMALGEKSGTNSPITLTEVICGRLGRASVRWR